MPDPASGNWATLPSAVSEACSGSRTGEGHVRDPAGRGRFLDLIVPLEALQPVQALAQARNDYLDAVLAYNRAQFRLFHALGQPPLLEGHSEAESPPQSRSRGSNLSPTPSSD